MKPATSYPALAIIEFDSITVGIIAADAMVKRAPIERIANGTVQPGRYLIVVVGDVAPVEEAVKAAESRAGGALKAQIILPNIHPQVADALTGNRNTESIPALGIIETNQAPAAILAADRGVKGANVSILEIRLADGLGGKGLVFFSGLVADVEAAIEIGTTSLAPGQLVEAGVIPQLHTEVAENLLHDTHFRHNIRRT